MPDPETGLKCALSSQSSLIHRVQENFKLIWTLPRMAVGAPHAANGAPIHFLELRRERTRFSGSGQRSLKTGPCCTFGSNQRGTVNRRAA